MAKDTDLSAINEVLDDLGAMLTHHGEMLTHLEARPIPEITGLERRLEELADTLTRTPLPEVVIHRGWGRWLVTVLVAGMVGWGGCWLTVQWMPDRMLPLGFSRVEPVKEKRKF